MTETDTQPVPSQTTTGQTLSRFSGNLIQTKHDGV